MLLAPARTMRRGSGGAARAGTGAPPLIFRRLRAGERGRLAEHLLRLPRQGRHMRFCALLSDEAVRRYCAGIDWRRAVVLGCFAEGEMCGAAELLRLDREVAPAAELALSVADPFQDRGIGTELARRALVLASNRLIASVHMTFLEENAKMRHIARKLGAELRIREGEAHARLTPRGPSCLSLLDEAAFEAEARLEAAFSAGAAGLGPAGHRPPGA